MSTVSMPPSPPPLPPRTAFPAPARPRGLPVSTKTRLVRFLLLGWGYHDIALECRCSLVTVYRVANNLLLHGSSRPPQLRKLGRPRKLTPADEDAVWDLLLEEGWQSLSEVAFWLLCERGALVSRSTVCRMLKRRKMTRKELRRVSFARSEELRRLWREDLRRFVAEDLVFLDESIFNEKTGWRYRAYGPIGQSIRYPANVQRGRTWSILAAMTVDGWVPCTGVKEGYFKTPDVLTWLRNALLPSLRTASLRPRVIIMDNNSVHIDAAITEAIEAEGHSVRFLPPYSPDFNPIELSFSVLKAWILRNYVWTRHMHAGFGDFLLWAVVESRCDSFAREQFRHSAGGLYLEEGERDRFFAWVRQWEASAESANAEEEGEEEEEEEIATEEAAEEIEIRRDAAI